MGRLWVPVSAIAGPASRAHIDLELLGVFALAIRFATAAQCNAECLKYWPPERWIAASAVGNFSCNYLMFHVRFDPLIGKSAIKLKLC